MQMPRLLSAPRILAFQVPGSGSALWGNRGASPCPRCLFGLGAAVVHDLVAAVPSGLGFACDRRASHIVFTSRSELLPLIHLPLHLLARSVSHIPHTSTQTVQLTSYQSHYSEQYSHTSSSSDNINLFSPTATTTTTARMTTPTPGPITTPLTTLLGISHPILLAGMARTSNGRLAAAVSNAGGLGVIGGFMYTPTQLREIVAELKSHLSSPTLPFGIDLALPQVGGNARKTNHDYTGGKLDELIDITIESGARLFVSAVGVPPKRIIDRLHDAGILVMNMVGHPKHAVKALELGVDMVCAQGGEGGGHTGDLASSVLIPAVVDVARGYFPKMLGGKQSALVVAAGGISNGRGLASALMQGAAGVWVGTRFVASVEAGCSEEHKEAVVSCGFDGTQTTLVISGRPLRMKTNEYIRKWHAQPGRVEELCGKGVVPLEHDLEEGNEIDLPHLMGQVAGAIRKVQPAGEIVDEMVAEAVDMLKLANVYLGGYKQSKL